VTFQAINIAQMFYLFEFVACLHMKFGIVEGYKLERKKISWKTQLNWEHW